MKTNALVIFYDGNKLSDDIIFKALARADISRELRVYHMDESEIGSHIASKLVQEDTPVLQQNTAEDNAVIFIGTKFAKTLKRGDKLKLALSIFYAMSDARNTPNNKDSRALMNALFILSQPDLCISEHLLQKYNMDEEKIAVIRDCYNKAQSL